MHRYRMALAAGALCALSLAGCTTMAALLSPSSAPATPSTAAYLDTEEKAFTALADLATGYAKSGIETPAQAAIVEAGRAAAWSNITSAKAANDAGESALAASLLNAADQGMGALTAYLAKAKSTAAYERRSLPVAALRPAVLS